MSMKLPAIIVAGLAASMVLAGCAGTAAAAPADGAKPADAAKPAAVAAAPLAGLEDTAFDASFFKAPAKPWIVDSFEREDGGKVFMATHAKVKWSNMSDENWGGWKSRSFKLFSDTLHATEGTKSLKIALDGKITGSTPNGACFGVGWQNEGPFDPKYVPYFKDIAYALVDYHFEKDAATDMGDPFLGFALHAVGTAKDNADSDFFITRKADGTAAMQLSTFFKDTTSAVPQFTLKVYTGFTTPKINGESKVNPDEKGKLLKGTLWIDNLRFADKDGNIFADL